MLRFQEHGIALATLVARGSQLRAPKKVVRTGVDSLVELLRVSVARNSRRDIDPIACKD
jgi:hypothetical protein